MKGIQSYNQWKKNATDSILIDSNWTVLVFVLFNLIKFIYSMIPWNIIADIARYKSASGPSRWGQQKQYKNKCTQNYLRCEKLKYELLPEISKKIKCTSLRHWKQKNNNFHLILHININFTVFCRIYILFYQQRIYDDNSDVTFVFK